MPLRSVSLIKNIADNCEDCGERCSRPSAYPYALILCTGCKFNRQAIDRVLPLPALHDLAFLLGPIFDFDEVDPDFPYGEWF